MTDLNSLPSGGPFLSARKVWERYDVTDRTIDRWIADPAMGFPQPITINKRRYFSESELTAWERRRAGRAA
jgi:predicted DNA-binding transcriptional regulator AlpA